MQAPQPKLPVRRFSGVARLYGERGLERLWRSHAVVVGLGGVGSWAVEALARSAIGSLTLIDLDHVSESNTNRQLVALESTLGAAKCEVMAKRIADISPGCLVRVVDDFVTPDNVAQCLPAGAIVIDAIDQPRAKAAMIALALGRQQEIVVCGAAGGLIGSPPITRGDLATTRNDPLLASVRGRLRRDHGFDRTLAKPFGVTALYVALPRPAGLRPATGRSGSPLACAGYGSSVTVTAPLGFAAAALAIEWIVGGAKGATT